MKHKLTVFILLTIPLIIFSCAKKVKVASTSPSTYEVEIPKAFSPNGDGNNDEACFSVKKTDTHVVQQSISIEIYNRWGNKVWETNDINQCWDGNNMADNKPLPSGVYFVKIEQSGKENKTGSITLLQ